MTDNQPGGILAELAEDAAGLYVLDLPDGDFTIPAPSFQQFTHWLRFREQPDHLAGTTQLFAVAGRRLERIRPHLPRREQVAAAGIAADIVAHYGLAALPVELAFQLDRYGGDIEYDMQDELGVDLLDWFRGRRPWRQLAREIRRLPAHLHYYSARAMDPELAQQQIDLPKPERRPPSPLGYSEDRFLQMAQVEAIRMLDNTLRRVNGNKATLPPPIERPMTALQLLERERDREYVYAHLERMGIET